MHRAAAAAQFLGDDVILRRHTGAAVDQEDDGIALGHRLHGLLRHLGQDAGLGHRLEAAGIDHQEGLEPMRPWP
jgi:hypothetical protein